MRQQCLHVFVFVFSRDSFVCLFPQLFDCEVPQPLKLIEAFVQDDEEYPTVCIGAQEA